MTRASTRLKPEMMTPMTPPAAPAMPCAISLTFAWAVSGAELCASSHEPTDELVRDVLDHAGQRVDEVPEAAGERREQQQHEDDRKGREPEDQCRRAGTPAEASVALHQAHDGLEHEGDEQRRGTAS